MFDYRAGPPPAEFDPENRHMLFRRGGATLGDCAMYTGMALLAAVVVALALAGWVA